MWIILKRFGRSAWVIVRATSKEYGRDKCSLIAAALAFWAFLSLVPLLLFLVAVFGMFGLSSERAMDLVSTEVVKAAPGVADGVMGLVGSVHRHSVSVGGLALVGLIWAASRGFSTLQTALGAIWGVAPGRAVRHVVLNRLQSLAMVVLSAIFMMISLGITSAVEALKRSTTLAFRIGPLPPLEESLLWVAAFLSAVVMFLTLYVIIPAPKIRLRDRVAAAGVGALLWEIAKFGFAVYVTRAATRSPVYASLGAPFLILLWAYWAATIFLLGAQLARALSSRARGELAAASN